MSGFPELVKGEVVLSDPSELLMRNVNPSWVDLGKPTSQAFKTTQKDSGRLSVARDSQVTPEDHYEEFTCGLGLNSVGVWAVSVAEVHAASSQAVDDQEAASRPSPCPRGHSYVDYRDLDTSGAVKSRARFLLSAALARGPLFEEVDRGTLVARSAAS